MRFTIATQSSRIGYKLVTDPVIRRGHRKLVVDTRNLPLNLTRLIPHAWSNKPKEAWQPFVEEAVRLGYL